METASERARKSDKDRESERKMAAVTHELKNKRVFNVLNYRENKNIHSLKEIQGTGNKKKLLWCIISVMGDSVSSHSLSLPPCFSGPKRRRSDGSRRHTGTAGLIWLISVRTTSNQAPQPVSLTPVSPWDTSIYTLTQCCNSPKCLQQPHHWSSGRFWFRKVVIQHIDSHEKKHMINVEWQSVAPCSICGDVRLQQQHII